ncbi:MAG: hypothetical protein ACM3QX_04075 [Syntrophomonadaceae bacterium]
MEKEILRELERLTQHYLNIAASLSSLSITKQKIIERGLQSFDKEDLASELASMKGRMQDLMKNLQNVQNSVSEIE